MQRRLWRQLRPLLHGHTDVIEVHVSQVPEAVLMIVEVDADGLAFVRGQIVGDQRPGLRIGRDLHDLRQRGARGILYLGLLPVVGDGVGRRRPVVERQGRFGCGAGNGDRLIERRIAIGFAAGTCSQLGAVGSSMFLHSCSEWQVDATGGPVGQSSGFESAVLNQLRGAGIHR